MADILQWLQWREMGQERSKLQTAFDATGL